MAFLCNKTYSLTFSCKLSQKNSLVRVSLFQALGSWRESEKRRRARKKREGKGFFPRLPAFYALLKLLRAWNRLRSWAHKRLSYGWKLSMRQPRPQGLFRFQEAANLGDAKITATPPFWKTRCREDPGDEVAWGRQQLSRSRGCTPKSCITSRELVLGYSLNVRAPRWQRQAEKMLTKMYIGVFLDLPFQLKINSALIMLYPLVFRSHNNRLSF